MYSILNYGGLANIGTREDPFLSTDYEERDGQPVRRGVGYAGGVNGGCELRDRKSVV